MSTTQAVAWPTLAVADLTAHPGNLLPEADADLTASIATSGIIDPLYVQRRGASAVVLDGLRRLAAAVAAGLDQVPVTDRPLMRVEHLTAHPRNVRQDLRITREYRESIRSEGILVELIVTHDDQGRVRVIDGHRRLAVAVAERLTHVPIRWAVRSESEQFLDMVTTSRHREQLTDHEEAVALFSAAEAGAELPRIARAAGRTQKVARQMIAAGGSEAARKVAKVGAKRTERPVTLEHYAAIAELEQRDPEAAERVIKAIGSSDYSSPTYVIEQERIALAQREKAAKRRTELEAAGAAIRDREELDPKKAARVADLDISTQAHRTCRGEVWTLEDGEYVAYCRNAVLYGHQDQDAVNEEKEQARAARRAVKLGNLEWDASTAPRREFLVSLIGRRTWPKGLRQQLETLIMETVVGGAYVFAERLNGQPTDEILAELTGQTPGMGRLAIVKAASKSPSRHLGWMLATVAAAYETRMQRGAWRTDTVQWRELRTQARHWLTQLTALGYQPTPIEAAVMADEPYEPGQQTKTLTAEPLSADNAEADEN
ncbi:ParB N-terminal domain-containing protein [Streptomyces sp. AV19]|uniref:ParB N-terminal domain-containing protein n=1 Tax=Streptomyces sp. AV19 TaxID=2793068 RepID=UPI0018FE50E4|nr:ParB N-terminal domain-containing protein [Streptomyces sp. AV19]MBH1939225.1 ParB N-terminal domain-containing protein [Streptomyces sp. AV19]MDG4537193.1 ParB N-terminal domain-containing protein [Streptomyces sp. AV19]